MLFVVVFSFFLNPPPLFPFRIGIFYASASLSGAFGGLLAFGITKMDGVSGVAGWRWIFIIEGIATVLVATLTAFLLPRGIETATFLTEEERRFAREYYSATVTSLY